MDGYLTVSAANTAIMQVDYALNTLALVTTPSWVGGAAASAAETLVTRREELFQARQQLALARAVLTERDQTRLALELLGAAS